MKRELFFCKKNISKTSVKKYDYLVLSLIFFISLVVIEIWFKGDFILKSLDSSYPINPVKDFIRATHGWWLQDLGIANIRAFAISILYYLPIAILHILHLPASVVQKILFCLLVSTSGWSMYLLMRKLILLNKQYAVISSFIAANFYMFNMYNLQFIYGAPLLILIYIYSLLPLIFLYFVKALENKRNLIVFGLLTFLISPVGNNPSYYVSLFLLLLSYFLYNFVFRVKKIGITQIFSKLFFIVLIFILLNAFWFLPVFLDIAGEYSVLKVTETTAFSSFSEMFRFLGWWAFTAGTKGYLYFPYCKIYYTPFFIFLGFLIPIISFSCALRKKSSSFTIFFLIMAIVGLFLEKGSVGPLASINDWLYKNIPYFMAFHNPNKFGMLFIVSIGVLLGISTQSILIKIDYLSRKFKFTKIIFIIFLLFLINFYAFPFWTGDIYPEQKDSILKSTRTKFPSYYKEFQSYVNSKPGQFRVLGLPSSRTVASGWIPYNWDYIGGDPLYHYLDKSYLLPTPYKPNIYAFDLYTCLFELSNKEAFVKETLPIFGCLNLKYIVVRNDVDQKFYGGFLPENVTREAQKLTQHQDLEFVGSFGQLDLYKVSDEYFLPRIYAYPR